MGDNSYNCNSNNKDPLIQISDQEASCSSSADLTICDSPLPQQQSQEDIMTNHRDTNTRPCTLTKSSSNTSLCSTSSNHSCLSSASSTNNNKNKPRSSMTPIPGRRLVHFSHIEVYEFPCLLGDNPSVSAGAPLTLGWTHTSKAKMDVRLFEQRRKPRRSGKDLQSSAQSRQEYLTEVAGYTQAEIEDAAHQAASIRRKREKTAAAATNHKAFDKLHLVLETIVRKSSKTTSSRALLQRHLKAASATSASPAKEQQANKASRAA